MTAPLYTMDEVAERLHKSRRWLQDFVRGMSIGRMAGRTRLFTVGLGGPKYDLGPLRDLVAWRDSRQGP